MLMQLGIMGGTVGVSVLSRWLAFKRVDSISMEIALASFSIRLFKAYTNYQQGCCKNWDIFLMVALLLIILALGAIHFFFFKQLNKKIADTISSAKPNETGSGTKNINELKRQALDCTLPLARHAVFLTYCSFFPNVRRGKRTARERYADLINSIAQLNCMVKEEDFVLPKKQQIIGLISFALLGLISIALGII